MGYFDSDDFIPFENVRVGDIVRDINNEEDSYTVLAKGTGPEELEQLIASSPKYRYSINPWADYGFEDENIKDWVVTNGPSDQPMIFWDYGEGVVAHESDREAREEFEDDDDDLYESVGKEFSLKKYLIENKWTESSRGKVRKHFNNVVLKEMKDPYDHHDSEYNDDWFSNEEADMAGDFRDRRFDDKVDECGDIEPTNLTDLIDEIGYTDDYGDGFDDDIDFSAGDAVVRDLAGGNVKARKAAEKGMKGTELDADVPDEADSDLPDDSDFVDPEDMDSEDVAGEEKSGDISGDVAAGLGDNARYVESLVGDADEYMSDHNYNVRLLARAVKAARKEIEDYGYQRLYLAPAMGQGGWENTRFQHTTNSPSHNASVFVVKRDA